MIKEISREFVLMEDAKLINRLIELIEKEDKKNPLTDEDIAKQLNISREKVNALRQKLSIPNSHLRREEVLLEAIDQITDADPYISLRKLTIELNKMGFHISTFGVRKYKDYLDEKKKKKRVTHKQPVSGISSYQAEKKAEPFADIIGADGSLKQVVKLAKAAALYPPYGLHTLIVGETGVGKSQLVEGMHQFLKSVKKKPSIPLVTFNCADYSDNPQLLVSQLFGYNKGSFTGADQDKPGLVEKANGGILFLDEIHRLPPNGQEILFRIIDKGEFSRLGETAHHRKVNLMIIGATTENLESSLLITFRRRIPFLIEIPSLENRPVIERLQLIQKFFAVESKRINASIYVPKELVEILLFYKVPGNIGQLRSDIQVICAEALLNSIYNDQRIIEITINELPKYIKAQMLEIKKEVKRNTNLIISSLRVFPHVEPTMEIENCLFRGNLFQLFEKVQKKIYESEKEEHTFNTEAKHIKELNDLVEAYMLDIESRHRRMSKQNLENIVGTQIVEIVEEICDQLIPDLKIKNTPFFNTFCLHAVVAYERMKAGKRITNFHLDTIRKNYPKAYSIALEINKFLSEKLDIDFPEDEAGFITLYLNYFAKKLQIHSNKKVGIVVATHGDVSKVMLHTAQEFLNLKHGIAITVNFDDDQKEILSKIKKAVAEADEGKGVLLLVDMEPLVDLGEIINEELEVSIKTIPRVDTLTLIEAISKAVLSSSTLEGIYNSILRLEKSLPFQIIKPK